MITEQAIVTRCHGKRVDLQLQRQSACGHCEMSRGCGTGALGRLLGRRVKPIVMDNDHDLKIGDSVILELSERALVKMSLLIYGLPIAGMMLAGMLVNFLFVDSEGLVLLASAAGFFIGFKFSSRLVNSTATPQIAASIVNIRVNSDLDFGSEKHV